jgi:uncharacterized membrane protein YwaF
MGVPEFAAMGAVTVAIVGALCAALYLLPTLIAALRQHDNTVGVALLNILLGWTVAGWIGVLIWAAAGKQKT